MHNRNYSDVLQHEPFKYKKTNKKLNELQVFKKVAVFFSSKKPSMHVAVLSSPRLKDGIAINCFNNLTASKYKSEIFIALLMH